MKISSSVFEEGGFIPKKYACDGADISPPLEWTSVPQGTKSLALICDDPDAPMGTWVHWVIFNIPLEVDSLDEGLSISEVLPNGAIQGNNDFGNTGYGGPCPPGGTHRYFFKIYALDKKLDIEEGITKAELLEAMQDHILEEAQLMGRYSR